MQHATIDSRAEMSDQVEVSCATSTALSACNIGRIRRMLGLKGLDLPCGMYYREIGWLFDSSCTNLSYRSEPTGRRPLRPSPSRPVFAPWGPAEPCRCSVTCFPMFASLPQSNCMLQLSFVESMNHVDRSSTIFSRRNMTSTIQNVTRLPQIDSNFGPLSPSDRPLPLPEELGRLSLFLSRCTSSQDGGPRPGCMDGKRSLVLIDRTGTI